MNRRLIDRRKGNQDTSFSERMCSVTTVVAKSRWKYLQNRFMACKLCLNNSSYGPDVQCTYRNALNIHLVWRKKLLKQARIFKVGLAPRPCCGTQTSFQRTCLHPLVLEPLFGNSTASFLQTIVRSWPSRADELR